MSAWDGGDVRGYLVAAGRPEPWSADVIEIERGELGWVFLILAIVLGGLGAAIHFGVGIGFMAAGGGFAIAAFFAAVSNIP